MQPTLTHHISTSGWQTEDANGVPVGKLETA